MLSSFPPVVALWSLGIADDGSLSQETLDWLGDLAEGAHERAGRTLCPLDLARAEEIALYPGGDHEVLVDGRAFYVEARDQRDTGLWIAHALAGAMLLRRKRYGVSGDLQAWALAAQLLVPAWSLGDPHPWAPEWLVTVRKRIQRAA